MIDDAKIRSALIDGFGIEPFRIEMEEFEFGDMVGVFYRPPEGAPLRCRASTAGKTQAEVTAELAGQMRKWFEPAAQPIKRRPGRPRKLAA